MNATATIDKDNWLKISIKPETAEESMKLVQLGMSRNAATDKVAGFYMANDRPEVYVSLRPKRDNKGNWIKLNNIPKVS